MSQKFIKSKNNNLRSTAYGKYFAKAVYDKGFIEIVVGTGDHFSVSELLQTKRPSAGKTA